MTRKWLAPLAAVSVIGVAQTVTPPPVKEGLWSIHTTSIDNPGSVKSEYSAKLCRSHAYDQHAQSLAKKMPGCKSVNESVHGGVYTSEMDCTVAGTNIKSKGTTTLHGDTAFRSDTHATYTPAFHGVTDSTMVIEQNYIGACPAGIQPGDRIAPNGAVTHSWKH